MRKDMILGMSIGGMVLAIVVVYLTISPSHKQKSVVQLDTGNGVADAQGDSEPQAASDRGNDSTGPSLARPDAHTGTGTRGAGSTSTEATGSLDAAPAPAGGGTQGDRPDVWHDRLYGRTDTLLMGNTQTPTNHPDPARGSDRPSTTTPPRDTVAMADHVPPAPGEISTGSLGSGGAAAASPTTLPAGTAGATNGTTAHRVQPGETFSSIALAAYGSASYFPHILRANPGLDPRRLRPGITINLPPESQVKPTEAPVTDQVLAAVSPGMPASPTVAAKAAPAAVDTAKEYRVKSGDNLHRIALKLYGKIGMVAPIYEANKATIGPDMAKLKLGMVLKLPAPPTVKQ